LCNDNTPNHEKYITTANTYSYTMKKHKYIMQILVDLKGEIDCNSHNRGLQHRILAMDRS
jgi:hypothetical protein